ncbi:RING finger domain protein [Penicillium riverlandense]|uniref:RING finger domain protein n=1 Tax=Penicillium riverlandense TaxID=1903569 RepID=UPI0025487561|nr:RING finger domain protein [Penicillium riverlandense]KAJ5812336.1 RING finger domain protein [Penicillium riverlandense]
METGSLGRAKSSRKRKSAGTLVPSNVELIDLTGDDPTPAPKRTPRAKKRRREDSNPPATPERRLRRFRPYPPASCMDRLHRSRTQRMYVVGHTVGGTDEVPEISFDMVGTTGNLYKTVIGKVPSCDCPDATKGNQCKHIFYVLVNALKAPEHLQYQLAFLSDELREMYRGSPCAADKLLPPKTRVASRDPSRGTVPSASWNSRQTRPSFSAARPAGTTFTRSVSINGPPPHVLPVRAPWKFDKPNHDLESLKKDGRVNAEGYVNVAEQFGLSGKREWSSYSPWFNRRRRRGLSRYDEYGDPYDSDDLSCDSNGVPIM